jgi:hypothetical protein
MQDPASTPVDTDNQLIQTEAALRRANKDQLDAAAILDELQTKLECSWWAKWRGRCG